MEKMEKGTHSTKMVADNLTKSTPNVPKFICPGTKVWYFDEKRLYWAPVLRDFIYYPLFKVLELYNFASRIKQATNSPLL